uniref:ferredoxin-type protein NapG n=1 Tax=Candidatus Electronema sp. TaxID=2698783 RepID=UPI004055F8DE
METEQPASSSRRRLLTETIPAAAGAAVLAVLLGGHQQSAQALPPHAIRPPGALPEEDFLAACLRCGQCVRACEKNLRQDKGGETTAPPAAFPTDAGAFVSQLAELGTNAPLETAVPVLRLAEIGSGIPAGTPYFVPRISPCRMCEDMPCVKACPSGALNNKKLASINEARMGLAVLVDHENCLNHQGLRCDVCYRNCPVIDKALTLEMQVNQRTGVHARLIPTVHSQHCTGCGKCERSCVLENPAIKVLPLAQAKGELGRHYRLGWEEKEKAGHSLIPPVLELPMRKPEELP